MDKITIDVSLLLTLILSGFFCWLAYVDGVSTGRRKEREENARRSFKESQNEIWDELISKDICPWNMDRKDGSMPLRLELASRNLQAALSNPALVGRKVFRDHGYAAAVALDSADALLLHFERRKEANLVYSSNEWINDGDHKNEKTH